MVVTAYVTEILIGVICLMMYPCSRHVVVFFLPNKHLNRKEKCRFLKAQDLLKYLHPNNFIALLSAKAFPPKYMGDKASYDDDGSGKGFMLLF